VRQSCPSLRLLFTSRPEQGIRDAVNSLDIPSVDLRLSHGISKDIRSYVSNVLDHDLRFVRLPSEGKKLAHETLIRRADGM
jgi:hypothetical protein